MIKDLKKCIIIYNPVSTGFKEDSINQIAKKVKEYGINPEFAKSMYQGHLPELIKEADERKTLIITLGGDGTVSESYRALNEINQKGYYSHVPTGTTNDMAKNYDVINKKTDKIVEDILNGDLFYLDSYKVNDYIAAYTSVFGFLANIPYDTPQNVKKLLGHAGYVTTALKDIVKKPVKYNITYETDTEKDTCDCIIGAVSNSKGFAGVNLYKNAKLDDGKLELLLLKDLDPLTIVKLFRSYLKDDIDLTKYKDKIITLQSKNIKLKFNDIYPEKAIDIDGENSNIKPNFIDDTVNFEIAKKIKVIKRKP